MFHFPSETHQLIVVIVINVQLARNMASLLSDYDQKLASTELQWVHCHYHGKVGRSTWHEINLVDVST